MSAALVGIGEREITPSHSVPLAGFASRLNKPIRTVDRKLWVRAWWLGEGTNSIVLIVADVLWWAPEREREFRESISLRWQIPIDQILLHATHTHSAPQTSHVFVESLGEPADRWITYFESQALDAVEEAFHDQSPASLQRYVGTSAMGYNRRVELDEPNAPPGSIGLVDPTLTIIKISHPNGSPRGLIFHHACHPTTTSGPAVSSEWPGIACEMLRNQYGQVSMLQGTCGDINPRVTRGRPERDSTDDDVAKVAHEIVQDVRRALDSTPEPLSGGAINVRTATVDCRVLSVPDEVNLAKMDKGEPLDQEWARALLRFPSRCVAKQPLHITRLSLGESLEFVALSAEVTTAYGLVIKQIGGQNVLPLGYTNGRTGYIVTDAQVRNGGYEPDLSTKYFALPSAFAPGLEAAVVAGIRTVLEPEATQ